MKRKGRKRRENSKGKEKKKDSHSLPAVDIHPISKTYTFATSTN